jgi:hypothetical protein
MMENIQFRRAMTTGPKSRVPFGIEGLLMTRNLTFVATSQLNECDNGQNGHAEKYVLHAD